MSAKEELIAAALTVAGAVRWQYPELSDELRELCARAMVQPAAPDMVEVERLAHAYADAKVVRYGLLAELPHMADPEQACTALLDYVRGVLAERDALIADNERLSGLYEQAVKGRADMRSALRDARAAAPQPVSATEVPMPREYQGAKVGTEEGGDAYTAGYFDGEAAGYARGLKEAGTDAELLKCLHSLYHAPLGQGDYAAAGELLKRLGAA